MSAESAARDVLCRTALSLYERGLTHGSTGNLSLRLDDGYLLSPTGVSLGALDPARLARLDSDGRHLAGDRPTKESFLHRTMYRQRPQSGAVVHLHSTHSVAVSCLADPAAPAAMQLLAAWGSQQRKAARAAPISPGERDALAAQGNAMQPRDATLHAALQLWLETH